MADTVTIVTNVTNGATLTGNASPSSTVSTSVNGGTTVTSQVTSGAKGAKGDKGDTGEQGPQGNPTTVNSKSGPSITLTPDDLDDTATTNKFVTATDLTNLSNLSGTNTGDQDLSVLQPKDATLTALAAHNTNGILTQTAADTFTGRTITGTANQVTVTNGDGVSGNPTLSLPQDIHTGASPTFDNLTLTAYGGIYNGAQKVFEIGSWGTPTNGIGMEAAPTGNGATLYSTGGDTNIDLNLTTKGVGNISANANTHPGADSTYTLGTSSLYWSNTYTDRLYLNSTAYLDGGTAGRVTVSATAGVRLFETNTVGDTTDGPDFRVYRNATEGTDYIEFKVDQYRNAYINSNVGLLFRAATLGGIIFDGIVGNIDFRDETYTAYITLERTTRNLLIKKGSIVLTDAGNIVAGTTTGTKIGTATTQKLGFFNATPVVQPSGNALTALSNLGLVATPTLAISDTTGLQTALDNKLDDTQFSGLSKITVGTSAPSSPAIGDLWVDTN